MKIGIETAKKYLQNPKKAIMDAQSYRFSQVELQDAIDEIIKDIAPVLGGKAYLLNSTWFDIGTVMSSQDYLDENIKPFVKEINKKLNWNINTPTNIMDLT